MVKVYDIFGKYISQTELAMPDDNSDVYAMAADSRDNIILLHRAVCMFTQKQGSLSRSIM